MSDCPGQDQVAAKLREGAGEPVSQPLPVRRPRPSLRRRERSRQTHCNHAG